MKNKILIIGDALTLLIVTLIGFAEHHETNISFLPRMSAIYFPLVISWFLLAPWFGLFNNTVIFNKHQLWRVGMAMFFAGPLAVVVRGFILYSSIDSIFPIIISIGSALGMTVWRMLYSILKR